MRILLTGANGLLGYNIMLRLLEQGHSVVAIVRNTEFVRRDGACPVSTGLILVYGSFMNPAVLNMASCNCDAIIHCAAVTDMSLTHYDDYLKVNRDGTELLLRTAQRLGIKTFIYISSANTIGYGSATQPANESHPAQEPFAQSFYTRSKIEAEQLMEKYGRNGDGLHYITLNPGFMIGPHDSKPSSGKLLLAALRKPIMAAPTGGKSFVPVKDVAAAAVNALTKGRHGGRYLLTGESMSLIEFYRMQSTVCGYRQCIIPLWKPFALAIGLAGDLLRRAGIKTQLSSNNIRQLYVKEYYDNSKATAELNMPHTSLADAIKEFIASRQKETITQ